MALRALKAFLFGRPLPLPFREREDEERLRPLDPCEELRLGDFPRDGEPRGVAPGDRPLFGFRIRVMCL